MPLIPPVTIWWAVSRSYLKPQTSTSGTDCRSDLSGHHLILGSYQPRDGASAQVRLETPFLIFEQSCQESWVITPIIPTNPCVWHMTGCPVLSVGWFSTPISQISKRLCKSQSSFKWWQCYLVLTLRLTLAYSQQHQLYIDANITKLGELLSLVWSCWFLRVLDLDFS